MKFFIKQQAKMKNQKGFTLIELLIVIAILAILALLGLPRLAAFRADAQAREVISTAETIGRAAEAYNAALPVTIPVTVPLPADVALYLDLETQARMGGVDFTVAFNAVDPIITVTYNGILIDSNAIGTVGPGEVIYPVFSAADAADAD